MKLPKNFGGQGFGQMLEQAKAAMARAQDLEEELEKERIKVDRGPVKAIFDGTGQLLKIEIDKSVVDPTDIETLEDLVVSTVKAGFSSATELRNAKVQSIVPNVPGLDL
jgi:DNA-binding YbaB/EbfC family protein